MRVQEKFVLVPRDLLRLVLDQAEQTIGMSANGSPTEITEQPDFKLAADRIEVLRRCAGFITTVASVPAADAVVEAQMTEA